MICSKFQEYGIIGNSLLNEQIEFFLWVNI